VPSGHGGSSSETDRGSSAISTSGADDRRCRDARLSARPDATGQPRGHARDAVDVDALDADALEDHALDLDELRPDALDLDAVDVDALDLDALTLGTLRG
jgi:hypothetical protein